MRIKTIACAAMSILLACAFSSVALADEVTGSTDQASGSGAEYNEPDAEGPGEVISYKDYVGTSFWNSGHTIEYTIKTVKYSASSSPHYSGTVAVRAYKGGATAKVPATVSKRFEVTVDNGMYLEESLFSFKVTSIGDNAFNNSKGHKIKSLTIGENVTSIGKRAFYKCAKLTKITYKGKALGNAAKFTSKGKLKKSPVAKEAFAGTPRSCKAYTPTETDYRKLQYKQGVRASMSYAGFKGIVY